MKKERNPSQDSCGCCREPFPYKTYDEILSEKNRRTRFRQGLAVVLWIFLAFSAVIVGIGMILTRTFSVSKLLWGEREATAGTGVLVGQMNGEGEEDPALSAKDSELSRKQAAALVLSARDWVVRVRGEVSGSGVVLWENGFILTSSHLIGESGGISVTLRDGGEYSAFVVGDDPFTDLALIKIDAAGLTAAPVEDRVDIQAGQAAAVLGWPEDSTGIRVQRVTLREPSRRALAAGVMEELAETGETLKAGLSGGAVLDGDGHLLGFVSDCAVPGEEEGCLIPAGQALRIARSLADKGYVAGRAALGLLVSRTSDEDKSGPLGLLVEEVLPGSCAADAGLLPGDIITHVGGYRVTTLAGAWRQRNAYSVGEGLDLVWIRDGVRHAALVQVIDLHDAGKGCNF